MNSNLYSGMTNVREHLQPNLLSRNSDIQQLFENQKQRIDQASEKLKLEELHAGFNEGQDISLLLNALEKSSKFLSHGRLLSLFFPRSDLNQMSQLMSKVIGIASSHPNLENQENLSLSELKNDSFVIKRNKALTPKKYPSRKISSAARKIVSEWIESNPGERVPTILEKQRLSRLTKLRLYQITAVSYTHLTLPTIYSV
eukprot:TRINITY_DN2638_c0_g1_i2.p1 TRINITY_DN2638_c0_g1~~TRINITY_DN2638_c0_g1_i2.p1  ORF type:complete len:200 (-),score=19.01 TRINITY_DN2638_c0_g1_i2:35-634(-)